MKKSSDIFLAATEQDADAAERVKKALEDAGLSVFAFWKERPSKARSNFLRRTLKESRATVAIVTKAALESPYVEMMVAASWALEKPIHLVLEGVRVQELPVMMRRFPNHPLAKLPNVVSEVLYGTKKSA